MDSFLFFEGEAYYPRPGLGDLVRVYGSIAEAVKHDPPTMGRWQMIAHRNNNLIYRDDDGVWECPSSFLPIDVEKVVEIYS